MDSLLKNGNRNILEDQIIDFDDYFFLSLEFVVSKKKYWFFTSKLKTLKFDLFF